MKKNILAWSVLVLLVAVISWWYYFGFKWDISNANPDYICVKSVTNQSCVISSWWAWQPDGTRIWTWTKATQVWYYHTRTSCEAGYGATHNWSTSAATSAANYMINTWNWGKLYSNWNQWASWRHSSNFTYSSSTCTVTQVDKVLPVWVIN